MILFRHVEGWFFIRIFDRYILRFDDLDSYDEFESGFQVLMQLLAIEDVEDIDQSQQIGGTIFKE